jgi:ubiquinone/menaquinone biosynthesis C-methylase UbiE
MDYPSHRVYRKLYARYFQGERTQQLVESLQTVAGLTVVDLCGGGGRLSRALLLAGADSVTLVDESADMVEEVPPTVIVRISGVLDWLLRTPRASFDAAVCQQAVNYWLEEVSVMQLARVLKPGARFAFNTFNRKPASTPTVKQYELDGLKYVEASWLIADDMVEHVQMCEGEPAHTTRFQWLSPEKLHKMLEPYFECEERQDGPASLWLCTRRPVLS